jgi:hypothetical protein
MCFRLGAGAYDGSDILCPRRIATSIGHRVRLAPAH